MRKGSITIFSMLSMILVTAVLFALLEGARFHEIRRLTQLQTELAMESVFANYNTFLWEEYHLLASNQAELEEILITTANSRYRADAPGINFLQFIVKDINIESYTLLTDGNGAAYIDAVAAYMEKNLSYETAKTLYSQYESIKNLTETSELDLSAIDSALKGIEEAKDTIEQSNTSTGTTGQMGNVENDVTEAIETIEENPLEEMKKLQNKGVLELVIEDTSKLSGKEMVLSNVVSQRTLQQGKNSVIHENDWFDRVLLQQYLLTYMSNYCNQQDERYFVYEAEYLVGGKASDVENLKTVVTQLLGIREMANFLYLVKNPQKVQEANILAIALVGASANPALIKLVETAILTAWAFAESVLDVRGLLIGKKIPLMKSEDLWTLDLENMTSITTGYAVAKESSQGVSYEGYLGILLLLQQENSLTMRAMDIQEAAIQKQYEMPEFRIDQLMINAQAEIIYSYRPIFFSVDKLMPANRWNYEISTKASYGYN